MHPKNFHSWLDRRIIGLEQNLDLLKEGFEQEAIHDFRVEVKRIRAFIHLLNTSGKRDKIRLSPALHSFYHSLGTMRNVNLQKNRIGSLCKDLFFDSPEFYSHLLSKESLEAKNRATGVMKNVSIKGLKRTLIEQTGKKITHDMSIHYVIGKRIQLACLLARTNYTDEALHEIRKELKEIEYNWRFIKKLIPSFLPLFFTQKQNIARLNETLGSFQDLCIASALLSDSWMEQVPLISERVTLVSLAKELQQSKNKLKREITLLLAPLKTTIRSGQAYMPKINIDFSPKEDLRSEELVQ